MKYIINTFSLASPVAIVIVVIIVIVHLMIIASSTLPSCARLNPATPSPQSQWHFWGEVGRGTTLRPDCCLFVVRRFW